MSKIVLVSKNSKRVAGEINISNDALILKIPYLATKEITESILNNLRKNFVLSNHNAHKKSKLKKTK